METEEKIETAEEPEVQGAGGDSGPVRETGIFVYDLGAFDPDTLLDLGGLCGLFRCCSRSIRRMIMKGELPPPVRLGVRQVWQVGRITSWIAARAAVAEKSAARAQAKIAKLCP